MILYFSGGSSSTTVKEFMQRHNCSRLFSYYNDKKIVESRICDDVFLDCGAWTAYTKGVTIDLQQYLKYLQDHKDCYTVAASLDVIPNHGDYETSARISIENFKQIRSTIGKEYNIIPTYHRNESIHRLWNLLNYEDDFGKLDYIGIGAVASNKSRTVRMDFLETVFYDISKMRPDIKIHLFGLTDLSLLARYPVYSADSTTWIMAGAMGEILTKFGRIKISEKNFAGDAYNAFTVEEKDLISAYVKEYGFNIDQLRESCEDRQLFNVLYMKRYVDSLQSTIKISRKRRLF